MVICPFDPLANGNVPLSTTKLRVLVRSAVVAKAIAKNVSPAPGGVLNTIWSFDTT